MIPPLPHTVYIANSIVWGDSTMEPSRGKSICVPFDSEEHYAACVADPESFRQHLTEVFGQHPELFPTRMSEGFVLHDKSWSIKPQVMLRRLALKATAAVFLVRPSFLMPYMVGRTAAVEKALSLRHWGGPSTPWFTCSGTTRCTGIGRSWPGDGLQSWAAPSNSPSNSPRLCSPTRSTPGLWDKRFRLRPRWEAAASSARP